MILISEGENWKRKVEGFFHLLSLHICSALVGSGQSGHRKACSLSLSLYLPKRPKSKIQLHCLLPQSDRTQTWELFNSSQNRILGNFSFCSYSPVGLVGSPPSSAHIFTTFGLWVFSISSLVIWFLFSSVQRTTYFILHTTTS